MQAKRTERPVRLVWWLTAALVLLIGFATLTPLPQGQAAPGSDKLYHFIAFAVLVLPLGWAYPRYVFAIVIAAAIYGGLIEVIQPHFGRGAELLDALAGGAGALAGALIGRSLGLWQDARRISRAR